MVSMQFHLNIHGPNNDWQISLVPGNTMIGRVQGNTLLLENAQVSRQHAQITCTKTDVHISDLHSSNGTYVNGQKLTPGMVTALQPTDRIKIGPFELVLVGEQAEEDSQPVDIQPAHASGEVERTEEDQPDPGMPSPSVEPAPLLIEVPRPPEAAALRELPMDGIDGSDGSAPPGDGLDTAIGIDGFEMVPRGMTVHSQRLIHFLPGIYQTDFMERFLGIFESILTPIEWDVDNFDLFLDPRTAPSGFLPWLASWFGILLQPEWSDAQRRAFIKQAHFLFARQGTRLALAELLQIFIGQPVEIDDTSTNLPPHTFRVRLPVRQEQVNLSQLSVLIDAHKPAHTSYFLEFVR